LVETTLVLSEREKVLLLFFGLTGSASLDSPRLFLVAFFLFDEDDNADDSLVVFNVHTKPS